MLFFSQEMDIMCIKKTNVGNFVLSIIKKDSAVYNILKSFFPLITMMAATLHSAKNLQVRS